MFIFFKSFSRLEEAVNAGPGLTAKLREIDERIEQLVVSFFKKKLFCRSIAIFGDFDHAHVPRSGWAGAGN